MQMPKELLPKELLTDLLKATSRSFYLIPHDGTLLFARTVRPGQER
jgi:hypothetical protein